MCRSRRSARTSSIRIWSPTGSTRYRSGWTPLVTRLCSPINSAANARAAVRLPTPAGPWKRYACAGPSESAARSRRFASCCSGKLSNASTDLLCDLLGRLLAVDGHDAVGEHRRQLAVRAVDGAVEVFTFALDAVGEACPGRCSRRIDENEDDAVWEQPADRGLVQLQDRLDAEPARDSLVGERRVDVAVADDVLAGLERGADHALHELRPRGGEQRPLGPGGHVPAGPGQPPPPPAQRG